MTLKNKLELLNIEFTKLKDKILTKLSQKDTAIQEQKEQNQETVCQLESTLKENSTNEQILETLLTEFQELAQSLE
jgi:hypothetical protein